MPVQDAKKNIVRRPPVIAIMGHIDHGKSTLLDYIRKTNVVDKEAGGITQHIAAYEVEHTGKDGRKHPITFLDTPGHEAFKAIRQRGTQVADIAVLVVSAEDGVKPQTLEALECIKNDKLPYIVAINKIDKPAANIERTKQSLAENEIYIEGYGGTIPVVAISAKKGDGVDELLDMMLLVAEIEELTGNPKIAAYGTVIESNVDAKRGVAATLIIKDGTLIKGEYVVAEDSVAPVRYLENFAGKQISKASLGTPVQIIGWSKIPTVGATFESFKLKKEAEEKAGSWKTKIAPKAQTEKIEITEGEENNHVTLPLIIKADTAGSIEAIAHEILKLATETISPTLILSGVGTISENDVKRAISYKDALVISFHADVDTPAENLANRSGITILKFDVIYKLTEYISAELLKRKPKFKVEEIIGVAKIMKIFSTDKNRQVVGGKVETGMLKSGGTVKILRRDINIGEGSIRELQSQKSKTGEVLEGKEFGAMVESKIEIAPGDRLSVYTIVEK